jgi:hypothetical protein
MDATYNFSLGFAQGRESKTETPNRLINQKAIEIISTGVSLVSLFLGFSIFGILIIVNQHQAELNDLSGGSSCATFGGIGAILVGDGLLCRRLSPLEVLRTSGMEIGPCGFWPSLRIGCNSRQSLELDIELLTIPGNLSGTSRQTADRA